MHRFRDDHTWGERLLCFQNGAPTLEDIQVINKSCLVSDTHVPPNNVQVACYTNRDRDAINCATFENYCDLNGPKDGTVFYGAVMILMDLLEMKDSSDIFVGVTSNAVKGHFWGTCGKDGCDFGSNNNQRVNPVLKLYPNLLTYPRSERDLTPVCLRQTSRVPLVNEQEIRNIVTQRSIPK
jgi:hypothetical protein